MKHLAAFTASLSANPRPRFQCPHGFVALALACLGAWALGCFSGFTALFSHSRTAVLCCMALLLCLLFFVALRQKNATQRQRWLLFGIFAASFALQWVYVLSTPYFISPHDLGFFGMDKGQPFGNGHLGYAEYILQFGQLPNFDGRDIYGFYNPPLHHILLALWLGLNRALGLAESVCRENLQYLTLFYAAGCVLLSHRILHAFGVAGRWLLWLTALIALFPFFIYQSACLGNDILMLLFILLALLYTVRWYKNQTYGNILGIALGIGLGMMTKTNAALLAPAVAFVFVAVWGMHRANTAKYLRQFALFAAVCVPLGLFWVVREYVLFGMPFSYVLDLGGAASPLYLGGASVWQRLGWPALSQLSYAVAPYLPHLDCNILMQTFRTAVFDEGFIFTAHSAMLTGAAYGLLYGSILLCGVLHLFSAVELCARKGTDAVLRIFCVLAYAAVLLSYVVFCFRFPYICTQNFRYAAVLLVFPCVAGGLFLQRLDGCTAPRFARLRLVVSVCTRALILLVCALSTLCYLSVTVS